MQLQNGDFLAVQNKIKQLKDEHGCATFNTIVNEIRDDLDSGRISFAHIGMNDVCDLLELAIECAFVSAKSGAVSPTTAIRIAGIYRCEQSRIKASKKMPVAA